MHPASRSMSRLFSSQALLSAGSCSPRRRAGRAEAAPAVPAAPRTAASRDGDGRGASLAGRPRPAPPSSPPPAAAASSSAGRSAGRRRRPSPSSPPLRPRRAVSLGQGSLRRLPGMASVTAARHPPSRHRRRHFAGQPAGTTPIGRRRTAPGHHWSCGARADRRTRQRTLQRARAARAAAPQPAWAGSRALAFSSVPRPPSARRRLVPRAGCCQPLSCVPALC